MSDNVRSYVLNGLTKEEYEQFSAIVKENKDNEKREIRACNAIKKVHDALSEFINNGGSIIFTAPVRTTKMNLTADAENSSDPNDTALDLCKFFYNGVFYDMHTVMKNTIKNKTS